MTLVRPEMKRKKYAFLIFFMLMLLISCAGVRQKEPGNRVDQQLRSMSLEQKIGQMMVYGYTPHFPNDEDGQFRHLERLVKNYHLGGLILWRGDPYTAARTIEKIQSVSEIPLMIMADMEWGVTMRVNEGTTFLPNMAIGATNSEEYAYQMGKISAEEARAVGIHVNFAPVMDVNNNPDNIIINTRSYGEDPALVSKLGAAFIRGTQENGIIACAKHYPGHGDTDVDSHLGLPTIAASSERLNEVELVPFQAAVDAGVKMVMVAHITYSDFPQMEGRPATLDPYFIKDVLRKKMGFKGLVVTDAMGMGGVVNNYWSGQAAVMAINAGIDLVLDSPNFEPTFKFVLQAARDGRISMDRINEAVRRILEAKQELGLEKKPVMNWQHFEKVFAKPENRAQSEDIADAAITLLRDEKNVIPFKADRLDSVLVVAITDREWSYTYRDMLEREVSRRIPYVRSALIDPRSSAEEIKEIISEADSSQAVIAGLFITWGSYKGSVTMPDTTVKLLHELFSIEKPMAVVSYGSPYLIRQIPEVPTYLCAYATDHLAVRSSMKAVFGEIPLNAKIPVSIPALAEIGDGLSRPPYDMELVKEIDDDFMADAYQSIDQAIADSVFPGAQIAVVHDGKLIASRSFGHQTYDADSPEITSETMYDLASVTKVIATTAIAMRLYEQKKLRLDIPVKSYLPQFSGGMKDSVTVRHLLTHSAGILWWDALWKNAKTKEEALNYIYSLPLVYAPGDSMIYSDLGLIMVGQIIETVTGRSLDQLARQMIYEPMGMTETMFNPPKSLLSRIAPTEIGGSMNRGLIHGEVHDENAFFLGGVSAHAGLFSTAQDLAKFSQMLLNGGIYKNKRFYSPETIKYWTTAQNIPPGSNRALGWDTPSAKGSSAGDYFSTGSFGHLGFTGTSIWIDPNRKIAIVLLTNRVYPSREKKGIYGARREFYNRAMKALLQKMGLNINAETVAAD
ncbi:MAG: glycoside hydrolase family 3 N-terminal domain-containing protein [Calditrichia bacterium]